MNDFALKTIYSEANRCSKPAALQQLLFISNRTPSSKKANGEGAFLSSHCTSFLPELRSKGLKGVWASGSHPKTVLAATLPAQLKVLGNFYSGDRDLQEKHKDWQNRLKVYKGYFSSADPKCDDQPRPSVILLSPVCHKKRITLVCLAQGFHYEWPLDVIWERDGQKITRLSSATEPVRKEGECNFATASRLSVLAEEWQKGHNYSCHVNQTGPTQNIWVASFAN
uniref:Ig-like domain-containing protein n=1 Tax=Naja naja TaxID=35670 RepID=A0A8C6V6T7_NAJNA